MKISLGLFSVLFAVFCVSDAVNYPGQLFKDALSTQANINAKQSEIFESITVLRLKLAEVLKETSNITLAGIESDVKTIFDIDAPYRHLLYDEYPQNTPCMNNLRTRLNQETEFTGFHAGLCLWAYDRDVSAVLNEAYKIIGIYDGELSQFEMSVIEAFTLKNVWTQADEVRTLFTESYDNFLGVVRDLEAKINGLDINIKEQVAGFYAKLNTCYKDNQEKFANYVTRFDSEVLTCADFDRRTA